MLHSFCGSGVQACWVPAPGLLRLQSRCQPAVFSSRAGSPLPSSLDVGRVQLLAIVGLSSTVPKVSYRSLPHSPLYSKQLSYSSLLLEGPGQEKCLSSV
jgi:hypothetical protein